jgi:hypothetical protein
MLFPTRKKRSKTAIRGHCTGTARFLAGLFAGKLVLFAEKVKLFAGIRSLFAGIQDLFAENA